MASPVITIFVRHSANCKWAGDEFSRRCKCRKHFRWTHNGTQQRRRAGTRSWEEAEALKRKLEDQLAGRAPEPKSESRSVVECVEKFIKDKRVQGVSAGVIGKYTLELSRLTTFCTGENVCAIRGVTRELLTDFCATWPEIYPSSCTRSKVRERLRSFLRYCYEAQWLERIPQTPKIQVETIPTMPLTAVEYSRLLDALHIVNPRRWDGKLSSRELTAKTRAKVRALIQLMRWSGLAIRDALSLPVSGLVWDEAKQLHRVVTSRQKTGTDVSVVIPADVASELLAIAGGHTRYIFFSAGDVNLYHLARTFTNRYIRPLFEAANIPCDGHMVSHRLRDTFAVDLLEKGVPLEEVSKLLGHESIKTTERHYAKWVKGRQDRLDSLITATWRV